MKKVLILVEGQTEETFVREVLHPHFAAKEIYLLVTLFTTQSVKSGPNFKGGGLSYSRVKDDIKRLLRDTSAALVTTMIDFYQLPSSFPQPEHAGNLTSCYERVTAFEETFQKEINHPRFWPYFALHEFEAMTFVSPDHIVREFPQLRPRILKELQEIKSKFETPELINDENPPSYRLKKLIPAYEKILYGSLITIGIGLEQIRAECPHFNQWLLTLEAC